MEANWCLFRNLKFYTLFVKTQSLWHQLYKTIINISFSHKKMRSLAEILYHTCIYYLVCENFQILWSEYILQLSEEWGSDITFYHIAYRLSMELQALNTCIFHNTLVATWRQNVANKVSTVKRGKWRNIHKIRCFGG